MRPNATQEAIALAIKHGYVECFKEFTEVYILTILESMHNQLFANNGKEYQNISKCCSNLGLDYPLSRLLDTMSQINVRVELRTSNPKNESEDLRIELTSTSSNEGNTSYMYKILPYFFEKYSGIDEFNEKSDYFVQYGIDSFGKSKAGIEGQGIPLIPFIFICTDLFKSFSFFFHSMKNGKEYYLNSCRISCATFKSLYPMEIYKASMELYRMFLLIYHWQVFADHDLTVSYLKDLMNERRDLRKFEKESDKPEDEKLIWMNRLNLSYYDLRESSIIGLLRNYSNAMGELDAVQIGNINTDTFIDLIGYKKKINVDVIEELKTKPKFRELIKDLFLLDQIYDVHYSGHYPIFTLMSYYSLYKSVYGNYIIPTNRAI